MSTCPSKLSGCTRFRNGSRCSSADTARGVVAVGARHADVFQFTGLTHDPISGQPSAGGFTRADVARRHDWLQEAAGSRFDQLERSVLVQQTHIGPGSDQVRADVAARLEADASLVDETPFILVGSKSQIVEKLERLREDFGINHIVTRDPVDFAPIVAALAGR